MMVYALWHGGPSYRPSSAPDDTERFPSITAAVDAFENRAGNDPYYPCVENSEMWLFLAEPDGRDDYPDRIIRQGPRGGTVIDKTWSDGRLWGVTP